MFYHAHDGDRLRKRREERYKKLVLGAVHDASLAGQPNLNSQIGYMILFGSTNSWDETCLSHLIDRKNSNIGRKVASTLAVGANGASLAYDQIMHVHALCAEIVGVAILRLLRAASMETLGKQCVQKSFFVLEYSENPCMILLSNQPVLLRINEYPLTCWTSAKELGPTETKYD